MLSSTLPRSLQGISRAACSRQASLVAFVGTQARTFASVVPGTPVTAKSLVPSSSKAKTPAGHLRPHLGVEVNPNHGLYGFFRRVEKDGKVDYETVEVAEHGVTGSGTCYTYPAIR